jgi:hypothetical protein
MEKPAAEYPQVTQRTGFFSPTPLEQPQEDESLNRQYEKMDDDELQQLQEAYQKLCVPVPLGLRDELVRRLEGAARKVKPRAESSGLPNPLAIITPSSGGPSPAKHTSPSGGTMAPVPRKQTLPYNWGKFQGWVSLLVGAFAAVFLLFALVTGTKLDERAMEYAFVSPLLIVSGYTFVRRMKYAVAMTYTWMVLCVVSFLVSLIEAFTNKLLTLSSKAK